MYVSYSRLGCYEKKNANGGMQDVRSDFTKKQIFEFELNAEMASQELGPGDSFAVSPVIDNTATERSM